MKQDTLYLAIGPILLQGILIDQQQARVGGYKLHPVTLFCGESPRTGKNEHLLLRITAMIRSL